MASRLERSMLSIGVRKGNNLMSWLPDDIPEEVQQAWERKAEKLGLINQKRG